MDSDLQIEQDSPAEPGQPQVQSHRVQFRRELASLPYDEQVEAVQPVQMAGGDHWVSPEGDSPEAVHATASEGFSGGEGSLPHADRIQQSFGKHDVSGVRGHVGGPAAEATGKLGAAAYTSGERVAFRQAPSLHTAAHEAAHVVQQRAGVSLPGGVGRVGDAYERHADQVADRVVCGDSAEPLLDQSPTSGSSTGLQFEGLQFEGLQFEIVSGQEINPEDKVKFEGELAAAILSTPDAYMGAVRAVSAKMFAIIDAIAEEAVKLAGETSEEKFNEKKGELLNRLHITNDRYFGRPPKFDVPKEKVGEELRRFLSEGGNLEHHLMAQAKYLWEIHEPSYKADDARKVLEPAILESIVNELGGAAEAVNTVKSKVRGQTAEGEVNPFTERGRQGPAEGEEVPTVSQVSGIGARNVVDPETGEVKPEALFEEGYSGDVEFERGVDRWKLDTENPWIKQAVDVLKMPMAAGVSGTARDFMQVARILGVTGKDELIEYGCACLGMLGAAGAHSFHEVLTVVRAAGGTYTDGEYRGVYPSAFEGSGAFSALKAKWPQFLG